MPVLREQVFAIGTGDNNKRLKNLGIDFIDAVFQQAFVFIAVRHFLAAKACALTGGQYDSGHIAGFGWHIAAAPVSN